MDGLRKPRFSWIHMVIAAVIVLIIGATALESGAITVGIGANSQGRANVAHGSTAATPRSTASSTDIAHETLVTEPPPVDTLPAPKSEPKPQYVRDMQINEFAHTTKSAIWVDKSRHMWLDPSGVTTLFTQRITRVPITRLAEGFRVSTWETGESFTFKPRAYPPYQAKWIRVKDITPHTSNPADDPYWG